MSEKEYISQIEWENYVQAKDDLTRICNIPEKNMTDELWAKYRKVARIVRDIEEKYWDMVDELHQRYNDSLNRNF